MIKLGPSGIGAIKDIRETFANYKKIGIRVAEIPFTYGVFIRDKKTAEKIRKEAKDNRIRLSIHAPYWINLNSLEKEKIEASKKRILNCCEIGHYLSLKEKTRIIFHAGFFSGKDKEETYQIIKQGVLEIMEEIKKKKWNVELCPEIMGKLNVFGSIDEIARLKNETKCGFCIDFAHILARYKDYNFDLIKKMFPEDKWHCHFSGIVYGEKGEKHHKLTEKKEWKMVLDNLPKNKDIVIINESPEPVGDTLAGLGVLGKH